jgi:CDP-diacylglycerol--glycerol-3-phosphate 3-phosphatidyltransferase
MASVYDVKPAFQRLLRPAVRRLARAGATANQVTVAALVVSATAGAAIAATPADRSVLLILPVVLFLRMALNAIDGMLAREHAQASKLGAILNELGDVLSDAALYLPLALVPGLAPALVALIVVLAGASELSGVLVQLLGGSRRYDGPMGKSDRAFWFGLLGLLGGLGLPLVPWANWGLAVILGLLALTIINRVRRGLTEIAGK